MSPKDKYSYTNTTSHVFCSDWLNTHLFFLYYPCVLTHLPHCDITYTLCHITICSEVIYMHAEVNMSHKSALRNTCFHLLPFWYCTINCIHFVIYLIKFGSVAFTILGRRCLWSTLSNLFLKSNWRILTTFPVDSRAASQQCTHSTSASTVELPFTEPNWWVSIKSLNIHGELFSTPFQALAEHRS